MTIQLVILLLCNTTGTNSDWNHAKSMLLLRAGRICIVLNDIVHPSNEIRVSCISETLYSFAPLTKDFCAYFKKIKCSVSENFCIKSLQLEFCGGPWWSAIWIIIIGVVPFPSFFYVKSMSYITSCVEVCKYVNLYAAGCRNATESKKRSTLLTTTSYCQYFSDSIPIYHSEPSVFFSKATSPSVRLPKHL